MIIVAFIFRFTYDDSDISYMHLNIRTCWYSCTLYSNRIWFCCNKSYFRNCSFLLFSCRKNWRSMSFIFSICLAVIKVYAVISAIVPGRLAEYPTKIREVAALSLCYFLLYARESIRAKESEHNGVWFAVRFLWKSITVCVFLNICWSRKDALCCKLQTRVSRHRMQDGGPSW